MIMATVILQLVYNVLWLLIVLIPCQILISHACLKYLLQSQHLRSNEELMEDFGEGCIILDAKDLDKELYRNKSLSKLQLGGGEQEEDLLNQLLFTPCSHLLPNNELTVDYWRTVQELKSVKNFESLSQIVREAAEQIDEVDNFKCIYKLFETKLSR